MTASFLRPLLGTVFVACFVSAIPASGQVIVQDSFTDGGRTDGSDPLDINFFRGTDSITLSIVNDAALGGNALSSVSTATFQRFFGIIPGGISLQVGDTLTLSFDYRFTATPANAAGAFRFGLYFDNGTTQTGDTTTTGVRGNDVGYAVTTNAGSNSTNGTSIGSEASGDDVLGGSPPIVTLTDVVGGSSVASGTSAHSAAFSITRTSSGLAFSAKIDGGTAATGTTTTPNTTVFNEIAFGTGSTTASYNIDNVQLSVVPEPASGLLMLASGILVLARRRRLA